MTETVPAPALSFQQLSVTFATDAGTVRAVDEVTFDVKPGEVLAVVGESGSGKSVSSRAAIGLLPDTARVTGTVLLGDRDVAGLSDKQFTALRGKDIAMVFQEPGSALDPLFTVGYQVSEAVRAHSDMDRKQARERAVELLRMVRLPDPEHAIRLLPAPVVRRSEATRRHRVRDRLRPRGDHRRRADHRTRCHRAGRDPRTAAGSARPARQRHPADHPRHGRGGRPGRPRGGDERRQGRRDRARWNSCSPSRQQDYTRALLEAVPHLGSGPARTHRRRRRPDRGAGGRPADRGVPRADRRRTFQGRRRRQLHHRTWQNPWPGGRVGLGEVDDRALRGRTAEADVGHRDDPRPRHHRTESAAAAADAQQVRFRLPGSGDIAESPDARGRLRRRTAFGAQGHEGSAAARSGRRTPRRGAAAQGHR